MFLGCYNAFFPVEVGEHCRRHLQYSSDIRCLILFCFEFLYRFWKFNFVSPLQYSLLFQLFFFPPLVSRGGNERNTDSLCSYKINNSAFRCPLGATYQHAVTFYMTFQFLLCCQTERCKTKKNRCNFSTAAVSSSHLWFRLISWCDGVECRYFITVGFIIFMAQPSRGKRVIGRLKWPQLALLFPPSGSRTDI